MAMIDTARSANKGTGFGIRLTVVFSNALNSYQNWQRARKTRQALNKLSAFQLEDIGLCRADIDRLTR